MVSLGHAGKAENRRGGPGARGEAFAFQGSGRVDVRPGCGKALDVTCTFVYKICTRVLREEFIELLEAFRLPTICCTVVGVGRTYGLLLSALNKGEHPKQTRVCRSEGTSPRVLSARENLMRM